MYKILNYFPYLPPSDTECTKQAEKFRQTEAVYDCFTHTAAVLPTLRVCSSKKTQKKHTHLLKQNDDPVILPEKFNTVKSLFFYIYSPHCAKVSETASCQCVTVNSCGL